MLQQLESAARALKREVLALYYAANDARTAWYAKAIPFIALCYALSPVDLIPDFIPILGLLDDLILLPALIWLAIHLIPHEVMQDARRRAAEEPVRLAPNWLTACLIGAVWIASAELLLYWTIERFGSEELKDDRLPVLLLTSAFFALFFCLWLSSAIQHEAAKASKHPTGTAHAANNGQPGGRHEDGLGTDVQQPLLASEV
ncbi:hypothetical protein V8C86DRAFT_2563800 [Haematococcus lacustris]